MTEEGDQAAGGARSAPSPWSRETRVVGFSHRR
jgi:hypothetical protein